MGKPRAVEGDVVMMVYGIFVSDPETERLAELWDTAEAAGVKPVRVNTSTQNAP